jgi:eukaryotic-like serine/threonine-protein kinase
MGIVFAAYGAYDPELDRKVAIKLLLGEGGEQARARLQREAQSLARLSHPNVAVHDVGGFRDRGPWAVGRRPRPACTVFA